MEYSFLRIKNPDNTATNEDLGRVVYHLMDIIGFSEIKCIWYERGKQNQQHLHVVIKKKMPSDADIEKFSKQFKLKKMKYYKYGEPQLNDPLIEFGQVLVYKEDTSKYSWNLNEIKDNNHLNQILYEYRFKERDDDFID